MGKNVENNKNSVSLKLPKEDTKKRKMTLFQRIRAKSKRKKTIKAPVKTAFGSNLASMAEDQGAMMDDIIYSMNKEEKILDGDKNIDNKQKRKDSDIITDKEFKQLFSRSFFPKTAKQ